jgi:hypothetical protein
MIIIDNFNRLEKSIETTSLFQSIQHTTRNGTNSACELCRKFGAIICCSGNFLAFFRTLFKLKLLFN